MMYPRLFLVWTALLFSTPTWAQESPESRARVLFKTVPEYQRLSGLQNFENALTDYGYPPHAADLTGIVNTIQNQQSTYRQIMSEHRDVLTEIKSLAQYDSEINDLPQLLSEFDTFLKTRALSFSSKCTFCLRFSSKQQFQIQDLILWSQAQQFTLLVTGLQSLRTQWPELPEIKSIIGLKRNPRSSDSPTTENWIRYIRVTDTLKEDPNSEHRSDANEQEPEAPLDRSLLQRMDQRLKSLLISNNPQETKERDALKITLQSLNGILKLQQVTAAIASLEQVKRGLFNPPKIQIDSSFFETPHSWVTKAIQRESTGDEKQRKNLEQTAEAAFKFNADLILETDPSQNENPLATFQLSEGLSIAELKITRSQLISAPSALGSFRNMISKYSGQTIRELPLLLAFRPDLAAPIGDHLAQTQIDRFGKVFRALSKLNDGIIQKHPELFTVFEEWEASGGNYADIKLVKAPRPVPVGATSLRRQSILGNYLDWKPYLFGIINLEITHRLLIDPKNPEIQSAYFEKNSLPQRRLAIDTGVYSAEEKAKKKAEIAERENELNNILNPAIAQIKAHTLVEPNLAAQVFFEGNMDAEKEDQRRMNEILKLRTDAGIVTTPELEIFESLIWLNSVWANYFSFFDIDRNGRLDNQGLFLGAAAAPFLVVK